MRSGLGVAVECQDGGSVVVHTADDRQGGPTSLGAAASSRTPPVPASTGQPTAADTTFPTHKAAPTVSTGNVSPGSFSSMPHRGMRRSSTDGDL